MSCCGSGWWVLNTLLLRTLLNLLSMTCYLTFIKQAWDPIDYNLVFLASAVVRLTSIILVKQWKGLELLCVASDNRADFVWASVFIQNVSSWRASRVAADFSRVIYPA